MKLSLVIPCYNEELNIPLIFDRLIECMGNMPDVEIILVDNGSTDNSSEIIKNNIERVTNIKTVRVPVNKGYGYGILQGLQSASGDVLAWTHADMQTDPADVLKAFELYKLKGENAFIKGKRKNRKFIEFFFTFGMQIVTLLILKVYLSDINAQPKLFSRNFYEKYIKNNAPYDFSLDLYTLYIVKKHGYKLFTIPVVFADRKYGEAKGGGGASWNTRKKLIKRTFSYIMKLKNEL